MSKSETPKATVTKLEQGGYDVQFPEGGRVILNADDAKTQDEALKLATRELDRRSYVIGDTAETPRGKSTAGKAKNSEQKQSEKQAKAEQKEADKAAADAAKASEDRAKELQKEQERADRQAEKDAQQAADDTQAQNENQPEAEAK